MDKRIVLEDMKDYDFQIYQSLMFIANDPSIDFDYEDYRYVIIKEDGSEVELIKNGMNIKVTKENRVDYVNHVAKYYLYTNIHKEIHEFLRGFH